jgi:hypothetical protein
MNDSLIITNKSKSFKVAFALGMEQLLKFEDIIKPVGQYNAIVWLTDDSKVTLNSIKQIENITLNKSRQIKSICFSGNDYKSNKNISVSFESRMGYRFLSETVSYTIKDTDENVILLSNKLESLIADLNQWYGFLAFTDFEVLFFKGFIFTVCALAIAIFVGTTLGYFTYHKKDISSSNYGAQIFGAFVLLVVMVIFTDRCKSSIFPKGVFLIGPGVKKFNLNKNIHRGIITILTTIILGLLVNYIS